MLDSEKRIKEKVIEIYTVIIYLLSVITFEIGFCNTSLIQNIISGKDIHYNFSICRILIYIVIFVIYFIFKKSFVEKAKEVSKNKAKRVIIYLSIAAIIISILFVILVASIKPELLRALVIGLMAVFLGSIFLVYVSNDITKNVIITLSTFGIIFTFATNYNHAIDEKRHFMSAFNISFLNFDYAQNPITDKQVEALPQLSKYTTIDEFLTKRYIPEITNEVNKEDLPSLPANYSAILYMPAALGITIARFLGGSIIDMYILGRIFNLIAYGILICIALKLLPYKKNIFAIIFLMPMMILLAGTYSIDGICMGLISIFIAYCLKIYKENDTISLKQFLILLLLFMITLLAKHMAYISIALIVFMLPLKNTIKKNKKYIPIMIIIALIVLVVGIFILLKILGLNLGTDSRGSGHINSSEQIKFLVNNPISLIILLINHIKDTLLNFNWYVLLHQQVFFTNSANCVMFIMLPYILYVSITEDDYNFKIKDKIIMILTFFATFIITSFPLYLSFTQVGALHIAGYQTRYILPILPLILLSLSNNKLKCEAKENRNMSISIVSGIFIFVGLLQLIIV